MSQQIATAVFDSADFNHMIGAGWFVIKDFGGCQSCYQVTGFNGELPTIINLKGEDITLDWFVASHHLRTREIGCWWRAHFVPADCVKGSEIVKPRKFKQFSKSVSRLNHE